MANETRRSLLLRLQHDASEKDWQEFHRFYWRVTRSWARILGCSESIADDIHQNTMMAVIANIHTFRHSGDPGSFRKWLKTIVQRRVSDYFRWELKHSEVRRENETGGFGTGSPGRLPGDLCDPDVGREAMLDRVWLNHLMELAMDSARKRVSTEKYDSFRRYVIYEEPVEKVSIAMGIRAGTIFQHKSSFLDILREEFLGHLDGLHDLGPLLADASSARKQLKRILEDYIQNRKDLRETMVITEPDPELEDRFQLFQDLLTELPPPACGGNYLLLVEPQERRWCELLTITRIGAGEDCEIVLRADGVSRVHAQISLDDEGWRICDENSTNGTWRNGRRVGEWPLSPGDWLQFGDCRAVFCELFSKQVGA